MTSDIGGQNPQSHMNLYDPISDSQLSYMTASYMKRYTTLTLFLSDSDRKIKKSWKCIYLIKVRVMQSANRKMFIILQKNLIFISLLHYYIQDGKNYNNE
jgi:hypothetical protein